MIKKLHFKNIIKYFYENLSILNTKNKPATDLIIGAEYQEPHIGLFILSNPDKSFNTIYLKVDCKYNNESNLSKNIDFVLGELPYSDNSLDNIYFDNNVFKFIRSRGIKEAESKQSLINIINKLKAKGNLYIPFEQFSNCLDVFKDMLSINFDKKSDLNLYDKIIAFVRYEIITFPIFYSCEYPLGTKQDDTIKDYDYIQDIDRSEYDKYLISTKLTEEEKGKYGKYLEKNIEIINKNNMNRIKTRDIFRLHKDEILKCNIQVIEYILHKHFDIESVEMVEPLFKSNYSTNKNKNYTQELPWMKCTKI